MAITANTGLVPWWFTPKQPESDRLTRFKLKPLDGMERLDVAGELGAQRWAAAQKVALRFGLVDWENLEDEKGAEVPFSPKSIKLLPVDLLGEIAEQIIRGAEMDAEKAKN